MPKLGRVLETALYVADLERAGAFYDQILRPQPYTLTAGCAPMMWGATARCSLSGRSAAQAHRDPGRLHPAA